MNEIYEKSAQNINDNSLQSIVIEELSPELFIRCCWECSNVPDVKKRELFSYFTQNIERGNLVLFGATEINKFNLDRSTKLVGRICVQITEEIISRGQNCATFGWLDGDSQIIIQALLEKAVEWIKAKNRILKTTFNGKKAQKIKLIRGPISLPEEFGGIGCQIYGFQEPRMISMSTNRKELSQWIETSGWKPDAYYATVNGTSTPEWKSGVSIMEKQIKIVSMSKEEWINRIPEVNNLIQSTLGALFPDFNCNSVEEMLSTFSFHPNGNVLWTGALNEKNELIGILICLPNLWEKWTGKKIESINCDTVIIHPDYRNLGIFSALHNLGYENLKKFCQIRHFEGTMIWYTNIEAVQSMFTHGVIVRKHLVFQKRL